MRRSLAVLLAVGVILVAAEPSQAWTRGFRGHVVRSRVIVGVGPVFVGPYPYWYYPPPYYVYTPPPVVVQEPPVYVQQQIPPPPAPPVESYWYYCPSAKAYYPNVQSCPDAWVKVPSQ